MKRNRLSSRKRISADATELGRLATGLAESGGKLEDSFWETQLCDLVDKLLQAGAEDDLLLLIVVYTVFVVAASVIAGSISDRSGHRIALTVGSAVVQGVAGLVIAFALDTLHHVSPRGQHLVARQVLQRVRMYFRCHSLSFHRGG